jgi:hypothetical protein
MSWFGPDLHKSQPSETLVAVARKWDEHIIGRKFAESLKDELGRGRSKRFTNHSC